MADALSRKPQYLEEAAPSAAKHIFTPAVWKCSAATVDLDAVRRALQTDPFTQSKMEEVRQGAAKDAEFQIRDGLLIRKGALYVPGDELRAKVLQQLHDAPSAGHFGKDKTAELVARDFWWPKMRGEVEDYVARCDTCQRAKPVHRAPAGLLEPLPTPFEPWERVALDFVTDLPSSRGKTAVLVVVDLFTKMAHFIPCAKVATTEQTAKLFIDHVFRVHGLPRSILSDRGRQFISNFWQKLLGILNVKINLASARHPQTNGQAERVNAIMQQYLRCYANQQPSTWVDYLPLAEFAYNNTKHASTGVTPFFANNGRHPRTFPGLETTGEGEPQGAEHLAAELQEVHEQLRRNLELAKHAYKVQADRHRRVGEDIQVGDWVWLAAQAVPARTLAKKKLGHKQLGPYQVEAQINPVAFRLTLPEGSRMHLVFHRSVLTPYKAPHRFQAPGNAPDPRRQSPTGGEPRRATPINEVTEILDSRWGEEGVEYLLAEEGTPASANRWVPDYALEERYLKDEFHALFPQKPMPADFFDDWLFTPTLSASTFQGFSSDEETEPGWSTPRGSCSGVDTDRSYWWDDQPEEEWRRKWLKGPWHAAPDVLEGGEDMDVWGEDQGFEHEYKEMEAEEIDVDEHSTDWLDPEGGLHDGGIEQYPALAPQALERPEPTPGEGEGGRGGFEGGMDVRGSGTEPQEKEEMESEGEQSEGSAGGCDSDQGDSLSLSSESEDSQKEAPRVRARGASGESPSGSWKSGVASPPERSGGGESHRLEQKPPPAGGGSEAGLTTPPSESGGAEERAGPSSLLEGESSEGSSVAVRRKVGGCARAKFKGRGVRDSRKSGLGARSQSLPETGGGVRRIRLRRVQEGWDPRGQEDPEA
uniref:Gypsy retrotransposon integrase-like protein 1 n=1 Tax=Podarcis muralis TaxID=64176 RepID=A0A670I7Y0_PODMU